jgi:uncharacterized protein (DUF488 family)
MDRADGARRIIFTVGHSTRSHEELLGILRDAGVELLLDVRKVPRSRRHPQFEQAALASRLPDARIDYRHEPRLGGFRRPRPDSPNGGWEQQGFRGYADYMQTDEFAAALDELEALAGPRRVSIMCAEAQWWRCHRRLIADALTVRGWDVEHLGLGVQPQAHELPAFAVVADGRLTYPAAQERLGV